MAGNTVPIHGKVTRIAKGTAGSGTNIDFTNGYTIDVALDVGDKSRQGQNWKELLAGQAGWVATINGLLVLGNTEQKALMDSLITATPGTVLTGATALAFHLEDSADYLSGDSFITGFSTNPTIGDVVPVVLAVQGTGALSLAAG